MKISQLNETDKEKALERQKNSSDLWSKETDNLDDAFNWQQTAEKYEFWEKLHYKKFTKTKDEIQDRNFAIVIFISIVASICFFTLLTLIFKP